MRSHILSTLLACGLTAAAAGDAHAGLFRGRCGGHYVCYTVCYPCYPCEPYCYVAGPVMPGGEGAPTASAQPQTGDEVTPEEQKQLDELLKGKTPDLQNKLRDNWKVMTHAERKKFYDSIQEAIKQAKP